MLPVDLRPGAEPAGDSPWEPRYGYIHTDPVVLASALEAVRRRICAYGPLATTCDCKYGLGQSLTVTPPPAKAMSPGSEMTGCPELRSAIRMLLHPEELPAQVPVHTPTNVRLAFARLDLTTRALPRDLQQRVFELTEEIYQHGRADGRAAPPPPPPTRSEGLQNLAREVREVQGSELTLDGQDYVITTDRRIVEWLASYAHSPVEPGSGDEPPEVCACGWKPLVDDGGRDTDEGLRTHLDSARADFVARALARPSVDEGLVPA